LLCPVTLYFIDFPCTDDIGFYITIYGLKLAERVNNATDR
jgi:hypothetical protein